MSKLLKLKEWLTVNEAARHLSVLFGEDVNEADILRLALDGNMTLSVNFVNHAEAKRQKIIPIEDAERIVGLRGEMVVLGDYWTDTEVMVSDSDVVTINGVFDLAMVGGERLDVEHKFQCLTGRPEITLTCLDGSLVRSGDGTYWNLQDSFEPRVVDLPDGTKEKIPRSYYPAAGLPKDSFLVVRTSSLLTLVEQSIESKSERVPNQRERTTYLNIIGVLLEKYVKKDEPLINEIQQEYPAVPGLKTRTLQEKFADARRSLKSN